MGGVFNHINGNLYHYGGNNPVKYTDPDGETTLSFSIGCNAGAGEMVSRNYGFILGISSKRGFSFGTFTSTSVGALEGASAGFGGSITLDLFTDYVETGVTQSLVIGGSGGEGITCGGEVSTDLDSGNLALSFIFGFGGGTLGEAHELYTTTETTNLSEIFIKKLADIKTKFIDNLIDTIVGSIQR